MWVMIDNTFFGEINMKKSMLTFVVLIVAALTIPMVSAAATPTSNNGKSNGFVHGITISVDGEDYYMAGAPDGIDGATDIPGHYWVQAGPNQLVGKHYNTGPFGMASWWSSDAGDGELLWIVHAIIDTWSPDKAESYASRGYVHRHEFVSVADGSEHPTKVVWLKHTARTSFTFDGGPHPEFGSRYVTPGVDYNFLPNGMMLYNP